MPQSLLRQGMSTALDEESEAVKSTQSEDFIAAQTEPSLRRKATAGLFIVTLVWGATFIWMKQILNSIQPQYEEFGGPAVVSLMVLARFAIAAILMLLFFSKARSAVADKAMWKGGLLLGGLMLIGFVTQMVGLDEINPATSAFLTSLYVVLTALLTIIMTKTKPSRILLFAVLLATFGAGFIEGPPHLSWGWGEILTVICALFFALHIVYTQKVTQALNPIAITSTSFLVVVIGCFILLLFLTDISNREFWSLLVADGVIIPLLCLGIGGSFFCILMLNYFQRYLHPVQAAIIYAFEPVWATVYGLGLGLVDWTWWILIGGGALLLGNLMVEFAKKDDDKIIQRKEEAEPSNS